MTLSSAKNQSKKLAKKAIISLKHKVNANPKFKEKIMVLFKPFPGLKAKLKGVDANTDNAYMKMFRFDSQDQLPNNAKEFFKELNSAIKTKRVG